LQAADRLLADEIATIILIGNPSEINKLAGEMKLKNLNKAIIVDPVNHARKKEGSIRF
jgi:phosphate acetyltransferase